MSKVILILGASSDVGLNFIKKNHKEYDMIIAHYCSSRESLDAIRQEIGEKIVPVQGDFSDNQSIDDMILKIIQVNDSIQYVLHLSAPCIKNIKFAKIPVENYINGFQVQTISIVKILQRIIPFMTKVQYGKIVFLLTSCTNNNPPKYLNDYVTNKYALLGLMKALASEYAEKKICVNAVSPSMMETRFLENIPALIIEQNAKYAPMKRNALVEDVTPMLQFLLSDQSDYITGQNIVVSGGG